MLNVDEVITGSVAGNAYADHDLWRQLYEVANDRNQTIADRAKAIRYMDVVTGVPESDGIEDGPLVERYEKMAIELGEMEG